MATSSSKRRGIALGPRVDSAVSPDLLNAQPAEAAKTPAPPAAPESLAEQVAELRRLNADLDQRWQQQAEQMEQQLALLEQQRDQIAAQTRQLAAAGRGRESSGRVGILLTILLLVGAGALGYQYWPQITEKTGDFRGIVADASRLGPQLAAMRGQLSELTTDMGEMGGAIASLKEDVSTVRADVVALREDIDTSAQASADENTGQAAPRTATTMSSPYRNVRPRRPW